MIRSIVSMSILLMAPYYTVSEPVIHPIKLTPNIQPLEVVISSITPIDGDTSVLVSIRDNDSHEIRSQCVHKKQTIYYNDELNLIKISFMGNCPVPLINYQGQNYILPINGHIFHKHVLSDISTQTLKNTVQSIKLLHNEFDYVPMKIREFYTDIQAVIDARNSKYILPMPGAELPTNFNHLPNSPRPYRSDTTDGIHHGWDFYVNKGA